MRVHFANTEDADMYYMASSRIPDPFFLVDRGGKKVVFLNVLEIDAFKERNTDASIDVAPVEPMWKQAKKMEGDDSGTAKLALTLFRGYDLLKKTVEVARSFPLDVADFLRANGATLVVKHPFLPERGKKSFGEVAYIRENLAHTKEAFEFIESVLGEAEIKGDSLIYRGRELTSEAPNAGPHSEDVLERGNVLTVEPGLYYPEHGGVRIEDVVVVTETGYENLTNYPRIFTIP